MFLVTLSAFRGSSLRTASALEPITSANNTLDIKHVAAGKEEAGSAISPTKKAAEQQREVSSQHGYGRGGPMLDLNMDV